MFGSIAKTKNNLAARAGQALAEQLPVDQTTLRRIGWLMDPKHLKVAGIGVLGCMAAVSFFKNAGQMQMYRAAMGKELKKQLEPINKKLEELEAQNEELKRQNQQLQKQLER
jgi:tRNA A37 methylthiotransferase MiaB